MNKGKKSGTCRVCLSDDVVEATSIYENLMNLPIFSHINSIANVNISENDGLPHKVCHECVSELITAVTFKRKCENNNIILRTTSSIITDNVEHKNDIIDVKEFPNDNVKLEEQEVFDIPIIDASNSHGAWSDAIESDTDLADDNKESLGILISKPVSDDAVTLGTKQSDIKNKHRKSNYQPTLGVLKPKLKDLHLQCDDCKEYFRTKCKLRVHWKKVHLKEKLWCRLCQRGFTSFMSINRHKSDPPASCKEASRFIIEIIGKKRIFNCNKCDYKSNRLNSIVSHDRIHSGVKPFTCDICGSSFSQRSTLNSHKEVHKQYKDVITCQYCGKIVKGRIRIRNHLFVHSQKEVQCDVCKKTFKNKYILVKHMILHTGVKNIQCDICAKTFYAKAVLKSHNKIYHLDKRRTYECDICSYKTYRRDQARNHRIRHNGSNITCMKCGKFFDNEENLKCHEQKHLIRPNVCSICDKTFLRRDVLSHHYKMIHSKEVIDEVEQDKPVSSAKKITQTRQRKSTKKSKQKTQP